MVISTDYKIHRKILFIQSFGRNLFLTIILYLKLNYIDNYNFNDNLYIFFIKKCNNDCI